MVRAGSAVPVGMLFEVVVFVEDMARQVRFYAEVLGLQPSSGINLETAGSEKWVTFQSGTCTLALHAGGQKRFGEDAPQFYFYVDDIEVARADLVARGVVMSEVNCPDGRSYFCSGQDPEGNRFGIETRVLS
jgi:predicted enzyme related to lactoylglutathione lyase